MASMPVKCIIAVPAAKNRPAARSAVMPLNALFETVAAVVANMAISSERSVNPW